MFIYWVIFAVLALGALLNQSETPGRWRMMFLLCATVPTALMIGLRWKIGPDWQAYVDQFNYSRLYSFSEAIGHADPGYFGLYWLIHQFDGPFYMVNVVCGLVFSIGLSVFCLRQPNPWLAFLTAFPYLAVVVAMSGNRQALALGFLFLALTAFERGKLLTFILLMIAGSLFHGSVSLMLPICLLSYSRNNLQRTVLLVIAVLLGVYFLRDTFDDYARRYSVQAIQSSGVFYRVAMNGVAAALFLAFQRRFGVDEYQAKLWRNMSLATVALAVLLAIIPSSTAVDRFLLYLFPLQFFVLSRLPKALAVDRRSSGQLTFCIIVYAAVIQVTFLVFGTFAPSYVPYHSIFSV